MTEEIEMTEAQRVRAERKAAREAAKQEKRDLAAIQKEMGARGGGSKTGLWVVLVVLAVLLALAVGFFLHQAGTARTTAKSRFDDSFVRIGVDRYRRFASSKLHDIDRQRAALDKEFASLSSAECKQRYEKLRDALDKAVASARSKQSEFERAQSRFEDLREKAEKQNLADFMPKKWVVVEAVKKSAENTDESSFDPDEVVRKLNAVSKTLENLESSYKLLSDMADARSGFHVLIKELDEKELAKNFPEEFKKVKQKLADAEKAEGKSEWQEAREAYEAVAESLAPLRGKIPVLRGDTEKVRADYEKRVKELSETDISRYATEAWGRIRGIRDDANLLMQEFDYAGVVVKCTEGDTLVKATQEALKEAAAVLETRWKELTKQLTSVTGHRAFYEKNRAKNWRLLQEKVSDLQKLRRSDDNVALLGLITEVTKMVEALRSFRVELQAGLETVKTTILQLENNPLTKDIRLNYLQDAVEIEARKRSIARLLEQGRLERVVANSRELGKMYRKVLEKVATSLATSRTLQATCAERRKKFRKGLVAFHKRDATATSQLIKRGSELVKERHYVIAIPLFERALKLIPVQRFTVDRKGTVSDNKYGLMWVRELRSVSGNERGGMNWYEALKSVDKLSFAGLSDWRLPTEEELKHIARLTPDELKEHFPATPATGVFWSGIAEGAAAEALAVDYQDKRTNRRNKRDIYYVRPVRSPH